MRTAAAARQSSRFRRAMPREPLPPPTCPPATITAPIDPLPVFLRSGSVVTTQPVGSALTSAAARLRPYQLTLALAPDGRASGNLLLDE